MDKKVYSILIVDDEKKIRERIASKIKNIKRFSVAGESENGVDALDFLDKHQVDVVLTDIKMPYIDGIELAKAIRNDFPKVKVAFISGYNEFEYAKEAIKWNVISYLSKPITEEEISSCLSKIEKILDEEYQLLFNQERLDSIYHQYLPALVENQFNVLLATNDITEESLSKFKAFGIDLKFGKFLVGMIEFDVKEDFLLIEKLRVFLINVLKRKFENCHDFFYFNTGYGLAFILNDEKFDDKEIELKLTDTVLLKNEFSKIKVRIGVSEIFEDFKLFPNFVLQARKALSYGNYFNIENVMYYKDITTRKKVEIELTKEDIFELSYTLKFKSIDDIHQLFLRMMEDQELHEEYLLNKQYYILNLANVFIEFSKTLHVDLTKLLNQDILTTLSSFDQLKDLFTYLEELAVTIRNKNFETSQSKATQILQEAVNFMNQNYADSTLNMDLVCEELGISVSYLSILFKKEMNTTFNKYLVKLCIEKSMELLKYSKEKIIEIATKVGYNDVYYFSYSFKKYTGKSPREYRNE
ncbi:MAG: response regulator [Acholeplasmataceae bacterium]